MDRDESIHTSNKDEFTNDIAKDGMLKRTQVINTLWALKQSE